MKSLKELLNKYTYRVQWSSEDETHIGRCLEFPSLGADGSTPEEALKEIKKVVLASAEWMQEDGEPIPEPLGDKNFSGKLSLRIPPEMHRRLSIQATEEAVSLNQLIVSKLG